jgi:hypothetical protein
LSHVCWSYNSSKFNIISKIEYPAIRGYDSKEKRDMSPRDVILGLFELSLKYKSDGNTTQEIIKLFQNFLYGKTILKPL